MQSTFSRSTPQPAYWLSSESYHACPAALSLMPQLVGSQGQASEVSAASAALKPLPAMGRLRSTDARGMPRTMWMPNFRPCAWTKSARGLKVVDWIVAISFGGPGGPGVAGGGGGGSPCEDCADGKRAGTGT